MWACRRQPGGGGPTLARVGAHGGDDSGGNGGGGNEGLLGAGAAGRPWRRRRALAGGWRAQGGRGAAPFVAARIASPGVVCGVGEGTRRGKRRGRRRGRQADKCGFVNNCLAAAPRAPVAGLSARVGPRPGEPRRGPLARSAWRHGGRAQPPPATSMASWRRDARRPAPSFSWTRRCSRYSLSPSPNWRAALTRRDAASAPRGFLSACISVYYTHQ